MNCIYEKICPDIKKLDKGLEEKKPDMDLIYQFRDICDSYEEKRKECCGLYNHFKNLPSVIYLSEMSRINKSIRKGNHNLGGIKCLH
jgi:hypothetical protein